jgi:hypothetical protein
MHNAEWTGNAGTDQWNIGVAHSDVFLMFMFWFTPAGAGKWVKKTILTKD